jgi:hypothetical protein
MVSAKPSLDAIMVVVPFLFVRSSLWWEPDVMEPKGAHKDHKNQEQGYKDWHNDVLCCCIPDVLLAHSE